MGLLILLAAIQDGGLVVHELGVGLRARGVPPNIRRGPKETGSLYVGRADAWTPFEFDVENRGPALDGVLTVTDLAAYGDETLTYRMRLNLAQGTRKRVTFPVLSRADAGFRVEYADDAAGAVPLDGKRARAIGPPKTIPVRSALILVAADGGDFRAARFVSDGEDRFVVPIAPAALPDHALEYSGVELLVLDDLPIDGLSEAQQEAIVEYVARGGTLVVAASRNAAGLAGSRLEGLMPGTPGDVRNVESIPSLTAATGLACPLEGPVAVTTFALRDGAVSWGSDGAMAHRPYGRGTAIAVGFPLTASFVQQWEGSRMLMEGLMAGGRDPAIADPGAYQFTPVRRELAEALKDSIVKPIPEFGLVFWTVSAYALVVALLPYAVFSKLRRLEWAWGAIVALAGGGALSVYGLGREFELDRTTAVRVGIVEGGGEAGPRLRHNFYTFYATSGGTRDVAFASPAAVPYVFGGEIGLRGTRRRQAMTIAYDGARLRDLETFTQDSVLFEATDRARGLGGVRRSWVVFNGRIRLGEPGEPPETPVEDFLRFEAASGDRAESRCIPAVLNEAARVSERRGRPVLVRLHDGGRTLADASIDEIGLDFAFVEFDAWAERSWRAAWRVRRVTPEEEAWRYDEALYGDDGVEYLLRLDGIGSAKIERTTVALNGGPVRLEAYDWTAGAWRGLDRRMYLSTGSEVHVTPHGVGIARLRAKASGRSFSGRVDIQATAAVVAAVLPLAPGLCGGCSTGSTLMSVLAIAAAVAWGAIARDLGKRRTRQELSVSPWMVRGAAALLVSHMAIVLDRPGGACAFCLATLAAGLVSTLQLVRLTGSGERRWIGVAAIGGLLAGTAIAPYASAVAPPVTSDAWERLLQAPRLPVRRVMSVLSARCPVCQEFFVREAPTLRRELGDEYAVFWWCDPADQEAREWIAAEVGAGSEGELDSHMATTFNLLTELGFRDVPTTIVTRASGEVVLLGGPEEADEILRIARAAAQEGLGR